MSLLDDVSIVVTPNGYKAGELYAVIPVPTEGAELVTNGDFDSDLTGWTGYGTTSATGGVATIGASANSGILQGILTEGVRYTVTVNVTSYNGVGTAQFVNNNGNNLYTITETGIQTFTFISTIASSNLILRGVSNALFSVSSISVKEYTAADMDVTRATAATRVDENGLVNYAEIIGSEEVTDGDFTQEGAEKVTNGDFSVDSNWNQVGSNGWSIDTGTSTLNFTSASSYVFQGISTVSGKSYKVTLDIELDSGTIVAKSFSAQDVLTVTTTGRQTVIGYFTEIDSNANFGFVASGSASGKIHSVSVKEVGADWTKGAGWTISGGTASHTGAASYLSQDVLQVDTLYKVNISVTAVSGGGFVQIYMGNNPASVLISIIGDYTYYFTSQSSVTLGFALRSLGDVTIDNVSVKEAARDNVPRIDYTGGGCPHILAEPQRTNLVTTSEDFDAYRIAGSTVTPNSTTAPDGTNSGILVTQGVSTLVLRASNVVAPSTTYTFSGYFKSSSSVTQVTLDITDNGNTTFDLTSEWQRFSITAESRAGGSPYHFVDVTTNGIQGDTFYAWGLQVEEGSYATSYIPTSGSTVTRNQDIFTRDGIGSLINSTEGVLFAEIAALANDVTNRSICLSDGTSVNRILFRYEGSNIIRAFVLSGGTIYVNFTFTHNNINNLKFAIKWKVNDFAFWVNGNEVLTDASGNAPIGLNRLALDNGSGTQDFYGKVKQLQVYDTALTDEQLLQLTGESGTDFYESYAEMASALTYTIQ